MVPTPWRIEAREDEWCVIKETDGSVAGCHASRGKALKQQRALYANESSMSAAAHMMEYMPGDRVKVISGEEHGEGMGGAGTVREVSTFALGIELDAMPEDVHHWYVAAELEPEEEMKNMHASLTAAIAPLKPPREWFEMPEASGPIPLTFTSEGQIYGHLALWDTCHRGFLNGVYSDCIKAPRSQVNYGEFYAGGSIETAEGDMLPIGRLTYDTDHAPLTAGLRAATRHYDNTGSVGGFVQARDGRYGIWLSGTARSDLSLEGLRDMRANPPSGDWRLLKHGDLELIASLAVPVPGFPVTRSQLALAASADGKLEVTALILTGPVFADMEPSMDREEYEEKRDALLAAVLTSKKRKGLAKTSFAIPESRSYPIHDRAHAANALARSAGKPEAGRVKAAVCKRFPNMPACQK